ncbi:oligosaccharide flippase family protein [Psychrobacter sp. ASPA161_6]|uniref:oligosaccharide flippase family protein n=1 Tax=Psychrobacter sp. ASPA161_6 TaxID=3160962 RepID=UPI003F7D179B
MKNNFSSLAHIVFGVLVRVLGAVASFFSILILTNFLDKDDNANYFLLISLSIFISVVFRMGADNLLIKKVAQSDCNSKIDLSLSASLILYIVLITLILLFCIFVFIDDSLFWLYVLGMSAVIAINIVIGCIFNGLNKITLSVLLTMTVPSILFLLFIYILQYIGDLNIGNVYFISLMSNIVALLVSAFSLLLLLRIKRIKSNIKIVSLSTLLVSSKSFFGGSVIQSLYNQLPIFALGVFSTGSEVALFGVASRLSSILGYINSITSKYIALIHAKIKTKIESPTNISNAIKFITMFQVLSLILFIFFSERVLGIFGSGYEEAKITAILLIAAQVLNLFFQNHITSFQVTDKQYRALLFIMLNLLILVLFFGFFYVVSDLNSQNAAISVFLVLVISCVLIRIRKLI